MVVYKMIFYKKDAVQKNWRMVKKGKHFLFGCSLAFVAGAALTAPTVKADSIDNGTTVLQQLRQKV